MATVAEQPDMIPTGYSPPAMPAPSKLTNPTTESQWSILAGLRFVLAFCVVCQHISYWLTDRYDFARQLALFGTTPAVEAFFLVSGFSIAASVAAKPPLRFYQARFARIYPIYLVSLALSALPFVIFGPDGVKFLGGGVGHDIALKYYIRDLFFLQRYGVSIEPPANPVLWSLAIEVGLYVLAPLFLRISERRLNGIFFVSLAFYSLVHLTSFVPKEVAFHYLEIVQYAWLWLLGWMLYNNRENILLTIAAYLLPIFFFAFDGGVTVAPGGAFTLAVTVTLLRFGHLILVSPKAQKVLEYFGDLSWPLYATHFPVMIIIWNQTAAQTSTQFLPTILGVAVLTFHLIDKPGRNGINRLKFPPINHRTIISLQSQSTGLK